MSDVVIRVERLKKVFRQGLLMRKVEAVRSVSLEVQRGQIYGFLGPNGAGKTTTIKVLTGLISPTEGHAEIFGKPVETPDARERVGFLPENPYIYPYLTPREFVEMCGRLSGLSRRNAIQRTEVVLDRARILHAADRPVRRLSKGMLQRTGLAAALVAEPELLILDEPMSGLDPVGRKEVRDLIVEERAAGRTIFFSTHILSDVEMLCDHVTILREGRVVVTGKLSELLRSDVQRIDVAVRGTTEAFERWCEAEGHAVMRTGEGIAIGVEGQDRLQALLRRIMDEGLAISEVVPRSETLEDLFVREAISETSA